jgi:hypothetical protein
MEAVVFMLKKWRVVSEIVWERDGIILFDQRRDAKTNGREFE